jgi:hypothetical protein
VVGVLLLVTAHVLVLAGASARLRVSVLVSGGIALLIVVKHVAGLGLLGESRRRRPDDPGR